MDNWKLEKAAMQIAEHLYAKGWRDLDEATEADRAGAQVAYLDAVGNDIEITFNVSEWIFGRNNNQTAQQFLDALIYAEAERELSPLIDLALTRIKGLSHLDAMVDRAIDELKENVRDVA